MAKELMGKFIPHEDVELGYTRKLLEYYVTIPQKGLNSQTGLVLMISGFGDRADSNYQTEKLRPYLADKHNVVVAATNFWGTFRSLEVDITMDWLREVSDQYNIPLERVKQEFESKPFLEAVRSIVQYRGMKWLDRHCQVPFITGRGEYQSFGFLPALDYLVLLGEILKKYSINHKRIIAFGSSYGGYIAQLLGKYAPNTFSAIIDNSGYSRAPLKHVVGNEILEPDFQGEYMGCKFAASYNNPWTIMDELSPFYFSDACRQIRSLLVKKHRVSSETQYYIFHSSEDDLISVEDKDKAVAILREFNTVSYSRIGRSGIDGKIFKTLKHGMDASLRGLFDLVVEKSGNGLAKKDETTDFSLGSSLNFDCGAMNYMFEYQPDLSVKVSREEK